METRGARAGAARTPRSARSHAHAPRFGFGSPELSLSPAAYDGICQASSEWERLTRSERGERGERDKPRVTDVRGGTWTQIGRGSTGVLVAPEGALPAEHPLEGKQAVLKIVSGALRGPAASGPAASGPAGEFETMRLPCLAPYVPEPYGLVLVGDVPVGYSMRQYERSLEKHVQKHGLDGDMERAVYNVIVGVCAVVSCFDIKPANFVVSGTDVRMIDFGAVYCTPAGRKSPEQISAEIAMCTLLFCLTACRRDPESPTGSPSLLGLPFMTSTLLDHDKQPIPSVVAALSSLNADDDTVYRRAITNVQGECFRIVLTKRFRGGAQFTAVELLRLLSAYKKRVATKSAAFGASEPRCAVL